MLRIADLSFAYRGGPKVLDKLSLALNRGELLSLLGPSGCGKSTVLRIVAGLVNAEQGTLAWAEKPNVAFVFQDHALMPWATIADNVRLPGRLKGAIDETAVSDAIKAVGLSGLEERYPLQLSGGQRMRASVARALAAGADLILMDEPFGALDEILRFQMNDLLLSLAQERGLTVMFVTHSIFEAAYISDRVMVMNEGRIRGDVKPGLDRAKSGAEQRASTAFSGAAGAIADLMQEAAA